MIGQSLGGFSVQSVRKIEYLISEQRCILLVFWRKKHSKQSTLSTLDCTEHAKKLAVNKHKYYQFGSRPSQLQIIWKKNRIKSLGPITQTTLPWSLIAHFMILINPSSPTSEVKGSREDLMTYLDRSSQPAVSEYEHWLIQMFILPRRKIWEAIQLMPSGKAPGLDRFSLKFYKSLGLNYALF